MFPENKGSRVFSLMYLKLHIWVFPYTANIILFEVNVSYTPSPTQTESP